MADHPAEPDHGSCESAGEAAGAEKAIEGIRATKPDIAIIDLALPEGSGLSLIKSIKTEIPGTAIVVLSMHDERFYAERSFRAGARGYVMKGESTSSIAAAIRDVLDGKLYLSPECRRCSPNALRMETSPTCTRRSRSSATGNSKCSGFLARVTRHGRVAQSLNVSIKNGPSLLRAHQGKTANWANASELLRGGHPLLRRAVGGLTRRGQTKRSSGAAGISPPRSPRTGRESLNSYGSRHPAVCHIEAASARELWVGPDDADEPLTCGFGLCRKRLYLRRAHFLRWKSIRRKLSYSADL